MAKISDHIRHLWNSATAAPRTVAEYFRFRRGWKKIKDKIPQGDGHPVLVVPGMLSGDGYFKRFRRALSEKGYKAYGWNKRGPNMGLDDKTAEHLRARLEEISKENGGQKISLIGHSLGGVYARELARECPELVRDVITLGTPFGALAGGPAVPDLLRRIFNHFSGNPDWNNHPDIGPRCATPPPQPVTSIYSRADFIIGWRSCLNPAGSGSDNIEVTTTHMGLPFHLPSLVAVFDRLAQKEGAWQPFDALRYKDVARFQPGPQPADLPQDPKWKGGKTSPMLFRKPPL